MLIKTVAVYNRISRDNGESEDALLSHRTINTRLCESKGYQYELYEEIESGGKFEERSILLQLLRDIAQGLYDGLVVVELSRIARDNLYSQMIAKVLEDNNVPIITPNRIYNLSDESDRLMYDVESMISSKELRTITRRMRSGKLEGARRRRLSSSMSYIIIRKIFNKVHYERVNERTSITYPSENPLEIYMEVEHGDFVDLFIEPKK
ncbi:recombinase family protein [Bacillus cytotoxicus]|uniref:Recombinase family protein n=1 Tax=Bacillus cytotoxicus TaxID=580165 RepID=A0ACC6A4Y7_9BACI|nr:recombinase family protein [Bacillus cytotoxicus]